jgi:hypothetical protein
MTTPGVLGLATAAPRFLHRFRDEDAWDSFMNTEYLVDAFLAL